MRWSGNTQLRVIDPDLLERIPLHARTVLDVGCGFAIDSLTFAERGAIVTLADIHEENLEARGSVECAGAAKIRWIPPS